MILKKKKLLKDVEFKWIPIDRHYYLNLNRNCMYNCTSITDKKWLTNFLRVESLYLGVRVDTAWVKVKRLARTYITGDFIPTDVDDDSAKLFLRWEALECIMCDKYMCMVGDTDHELIKEETNFYLDKTDFDHFYLVKLIKFEIIDNNLCLMNSFEVIKMSDYKMINTIYEKLENKWSLKIRFYRKITKQYKIINSSIYGFWNETAIIYRHDANLIMFRNKQLYKVPNKKFGS